MRRKPNKRPEGGSSGAYLREWRLSRGFSLNKMVELTGRPKSSLSRYENGKSQYCRDILEEYAQHIGCTPADLLAGPPAVQIPENFWKVWEDIIDADAQAQALAILATFRKNGSNGNPL